MLELAYHSVLEPRDASYLADKVLIEIGTRSLREPSGKKEIESIVSRQMPGRRFTEHSFEVETVAPKRTFLEKAFLLHEEFLQPHEQIKDRLSRHLYDLERLMDTEHGISALNDRELYQSIIEHRSKFNQIRGLDYSKHGHKEIDFVPPQIVIKQWEADYNRMLANMIYGDALNFARLVERLEELRGRFREKL